MSNLHPIPVVIRRSEQRSAGNDPKARARFLATGAHTAGDFGLFEYTLPPGGGGPGAHYHERVSETFYLLDGELAVLRDTEWVTAGIGDVIYVPRGGVHGFRAAAEEIGARFLILFTPGVPREDYFDGLIELGAGGRTPTTDEIDAFAAQHDQINLRDWPTS